MITKGDSEPQHGWVGRFSIFATKSNANFFLVIILHRVLQARHGNHPEGHWAATPATINQVLLFALAHASIKSGVS